MTPTLKRLLTARTTLLLDQPFFGVLALHLQLIEDATAKTMYTNGQIIGYSPAFVATCSNDELTAVLAHEVMHCAAGHPWRRDAREPKKWNVACDYAINPIIRDAGFSLPKGCLLDSQYDGRSAEWIYDRLPDSDSPDGSQDSGDDDEQDSGGTADQPGEVRDAPSDAPTTESDWQQVTKQAEQMAKAQGKLPASMQRDIDRLTKPRVDWRSVLRRFVQELTNADYSWTQPNRRYIAHGLYLPSLRSERCGRLAVAIDTSGSIDAVLLGKFQSELQAIVADVKPSSVDVIYCDAIVHRVDTFTADDLIVLTPIGGGGTNFCPVFDAIDESGEPPRALIYLTDLYGSFPSAPPDYPVIWCCSSSVDRVPFGELVSCAD